MASPARAVEAPPNLTDEEYLVYLRAYYNARQKGKPADRARQSGLRAVKTQRKKVSSVGKPT